MSRGRHRPRKEKQRPKQAPPKREPKHVGPHDPHDTGIVAQYVFPVKHEKRVA